MLAKKALDRSMFKRLLPLLRPIRRSIFAVIGIELLLVFTVFLRPWFVRELLDRGLIQQADHWLLDERLVLWLGAGLAASWLVRFLLAGVSQFVAGGAAIRVLNALRVQVFAHVQGLSVSHFTGRQPIAAHQQ
jgi:ATP-binding cassette, subfamily B, bacterial